MVPFVVVFVVGKEDCSPVSDSDPPFLFLRDRPTPKPTARAIITSTPMTPVIIHFRRGCCCLDVLYADECSFDERFESAISQRNYYSYASVERDENGRESYLDPDGRFT